MTDKKSSPISPKKSTAKNGNAISGWNAASRPNTNDVALTLSSLPIMLVDIVGLPIAFGAGIFVYIVTSFLFEIWTNNVGKENYEIVMNWIATISGLLTLLLLLRVIAEVSYWFARNIMADPLAGIYISGGLALLVGLAVGYLIRFAKTELGIFKKYKRQ